VLLGTSEHNELLDSAGQDEGSDIMDKDMRWNLMRMVSYILFVTKSLLGVMHILDSIKHTKNSCVWHHVILGHATFYGAEGSYSMQVSCFTVPPCRLLTTMTK